MSGWSNRGRFKSRRPDSSSGFRSKLPANYNDTYTVSRPLPRAPGSFMWPNEAMDLVAKALAGSDVIAPNEPYEHLLVLTEDERYYHCYHFLIAPERHPGEGRRAVMVSDRTVHMRFELLGNDTSLDFARKLARYAEVLPSPRMIIATGACAGSIAPVLRDRVASNIQWITTDLRQRPKRDELFFGYSSYYVYGYTRYLEACAAGLIAHPDSQEIRHQRSQVKIAIDQQGAKTVFRPDLTFGRDVIALSMVYVDEELRRVGSAGLVSLKAV